ncbi:oxygen-independent coproporphyrinogen-III oxidase-like protein LL1139 [Planotetraspora thailandica]|uniref:Heme chaperone HemW n=1 Tax=Planotetraspora thailandica TaxID=487172 RepID=A0A8J3XXC0_9ACTN|nr:radical SAM protein [Planotetraspora thailandica]GII52758.1 oxygen-independent coproporphyrinogen-III oxidase-like protein LL1139 [Planotetraspora thailandica]
MINFLPGKSLMKFDRQLPFYNWLYPMKGQELDTVSHHEFHSGVGTEGVRTRALYFHIPFCETICTFCTLNRGLGNTGDEQIETYVQALLREIELKGRYASVTGIPIRAIFFGGGTPTTLTADQILRIGHAIRENFDLSALQEFTFEAEVKSVDDEKCAAMREIGVNKVRFGLQSFDPLYRELFNVTATIEQEYAAVELFRRYFDYTSFDMIYGMHGQTFEQFSRDIEYATGMGTPTIELYPITNIVTQAPLHAGYAKRGLQPLGFIDKMAMTIYLNQYLRASGFQQHNGHGFLRLPEGAQPGPDFISRDYLNIYNTHTWSYHDDELIGLGNSAVSQVGKYTVMNDDNRVTYVKNLMENNDVKINLSVGDDIPYERGIVLALPYFGWLDKSRIRWEHIDSEIVDKLGRLVDEKMLIEDEKEYRITELGWIWYVNMMYHLSPATDQAILDDFVALKRRTKGLTDGDNRMLPLLQVTAR